MRYDTRFTKPRALRAADTRVGDHLAFTNKADDAVEWLFDARDADGPDVVWTVVSSIGGDGILRFRFTNGYFEEFFAGQTVVIREAVER